MESLDDSLLQFLIQWTEGADISTEQDKGGDERENSPNSRLSGTVYSNTFQKQVCEDAWDKDYEYGGPGHNLKDVGWIRSYQNVETLLLQL